uniref:Uncharacterized protein n=1 Tax=Megaselia scalaris TaxID=36166 RepID=T1H3E1_MEGSC
MSKAYQQNTWSRNIGNTTSNNNGSSNHLHMQRSGSGYSCSYLVKTKANKKRLQSDFISSPWLLEFCCFFAHPCNFFVCCSSLRRITCPLTWGWAMYYQKTTTLPYNFPQTTLPAKKIGAF